MRKYLLMAIVAFVSIPAISQTSQLVFKTSTGQTHAISSTGLEIQFKDGNMVATNGQETLTLSLNDLATMEFSDTEVGISSIPTNDSGEVTITGINGITLGKYASLQEAAAGLSQGVYVVTSKTGETTKLIIRK